MTPESLPIVLSSWLCGHPRETDLMGPGCRSQYKRRGSAWRRTVGEGTWVGMGFRFSSGGNETDEARVQTDKGREAQRSLDVNKVGDQAAGVHPDNWAASKSNAVRL